MIQLKIHLFTLVLKQKFTISYHSRDTQNTLIVELEKDGIKGFGEATENSYYQVSTDDMIHQIESVREIIEMYEWKDPNTFYNILQQTHKLSSFALCALDMAFYDLFTKIIGKPLYKFLGLDISAPLIHTNYTIGLDSIEVMKQKMRDTPWDIYKIKLGTTQDINIIKELRNCTSAIFRVDANGAWGKEETIANSRLLAALGVEFIEQPMQAETLEEMEIVYKNSELPIIADESCVKEEDVSTCHKKFHGINIKLTKCGGITPALSMIKKARALDLKVMVGCMTESTVGISAIAHLVPLLDYVDMDGALLLKEESDPANGVQITSKKIIYPDVNGTGVTLKI